MSRYSFKVMATEDISVPELQVTLGPGLNVFHAEVEDLQQVRTLLSSLGVNVKEVISLTVEPFDDGIPSLEATVERLLK